MLWTCNVEAQKRCNAPFSNEKEVLIASQYGALKSVAAVRRKFCSRPAQLLSHNLPHGCRGYAQQLRTEKLFLAAWYGSNICRIFSTSSADFTVRPWDFDGETEPVDWNLSISRPLKSQPWWCAICMGSATGGDWRTCLPPFWGFKTLRQWVLHENNLLQNATVPPIYVFPPHCPGGGTSDVMPFLFLKRLPNFRYTAATLFSGPYWETIETSTSLWNDALQRFFGLDIVSL